MAKKKIACLLVHGIINKNVNRTEAEDDSRLGANTFGLQAAECVQGILDFYNELSSLSKDLNTSWDGFGRAFKAIEAWNKMLKSPEQAVALLRQLQKPVAALNLSLSAGVFEEHNRSLGMIDQELLRRFDHVVGKYKKARAPELASIDRTTAAIVEDIGADKLEFPNSEKLVSIVETDIVEGITEVWDMLRDCSLAINDLYHNNPGSKRLRGILAKIEIVELAEDDPARARKTLESLRSNYLLLRESVFQDDISDITVTGLLDFAQKSIENTNATLTQALAYVNSQ